MGPVRAVAFQAAAAHPPGYGVMLIHKGARLIGVARDALLLDGTDVLWARRRGVNLMAVAANEPAFRHGVMRVLAEFGHLGLMTAPAKSGFVRF